MTLRGFLPVKLNSKTHQECCPLGAPQFFDVGPDKTGAVLETAPVSRLKFGTPPAHLTNCADRVKIKLFT